MLTFNQILDRLDHEISRLVFKNNPKSLYDPIVYTLGLGGKRIRPALALLSCDAFGGDIRKVIKPALGIEIFHNFTLLHDDLMDDANLRRNKPTVHIKWDANTAILSGDAMVIAAYEQISETEQPYLKEILDLFTSTALDICGGQQYDMEFESRDDVSEEEYIEMIRLKTAVLIACALKSGAIMADASAKDAETLYRFGINIGLAFQLQDDWLDVYGDTKTFGKKIGGDILCNKKTFLLVNAMKLASPTVKAELMEWLSKEDAVDEEKIKAVTAIYDKLKINELTKGRIRMFYDEAMLNFSQLSLPDEQASVLLDVTGKLINRQV